MGGLEGLDLLGVLVPVGSREGGLRPRVSSVQAALKAETFFFNSELRRGVIGSNDLMYNALSVLNYCFSQLGVRRAKRRPEGDLCPPLIFLG